MAIIHFKEHVQDWQPLCLLNSRDSWDSIPWPLVVGRHLACFRLRISCFVRLFWPWSTNGGSIAFGLLGFSQFFWTTNSKVVQNGSQLNEILLDQCFLIDLKSTHSQKKHANRIQQLTDGEIIRTRTVFMFQKLPQWLTNKHLLQSLDKQEFGLS